MRHPVAHHHRSADFGGYEPPDYDNDSSLTMAAVGGYHGSRRRLDSAMSMASSRAGTYDRRSARSQMHQHQLQHQQQHQHMQPTRQQHDYGLEHPHQQQQRNIESMQKFNRSSRDVHDVSRDQYGNSKFEPPTSADPNHEPPQQHQQRNDRDAKFGAGFDDEQGFESDFNSPSNGGKSLRFSNDFSAGKEPAASTTAAGQSIGAAAAVGATNTSIPRPSSGTTSKLQLQSGVATVSSPAATSDGNNATASSVNSAAETVAGSALRTNDSRQTPTPKLRFDECVTVAKFDSNAAELFEDDDFSKAEFSFEAEDQWSEQLPKRTLKAGTSMHQQQLNHRRQQQIQQENLRKSESVNIFSKKQDDPFEDDDFFQASSGGGDAGDSQAGQTINGQQPQPQQKLQKQQQQPSFKWENDFAKFDDNI